MTQEEFYIWLLNYESRFPEFPEFNPEFLKNYEIAKLLLDKFGIDSLPKEQQRSLNLEATSAWFKVSKYIKLEYDIPEILQLLPERFVRDLDLQYSEIKFLPELKSVVGHFFLECSRIEFLPELMSVGDSLFFSKTKIQTLPKLESVGDCLFLGDSEIQSLPKLEFVGGILSLENSKIESLPKLESVGAYVDLRNSKIESLTKLESVGMYVDLRNSKIESLPKLESVGDKIHVSLGEETHWKGYFNESGRTDLAEKVTTA